MASQPNIEYEAAKFLQKLIHDSKDEPDKLATKLYVILQHMKASGKENSLPYQVISRAMETVVSQHGFDIESLQQPPNPRNNEAQIGHAINPHSAGGAPQDSNSSLRESDLRRPPAGPSGLVPDTLPGSVPHRSAISIEHDSPSSIDTKPANSTPYERRDSSSWEQQATQKDNRSSVKRKRPELSASDAHMDISQQQLDAHISIPDAKKGLMNRMDLPGPFPGTSSLEPSAGKGVVDSDYWRQKPPKDASISFTETSLQGNLSSTDQRETPMGGAACNPSDVSMKSGNPRDTGKSPMLSAPAYIMPFKEHHLKQLRAQCLVFLAFRNGLMPKKPHLEIALGSTLSKEGSSAEGVLGDPMDNKVKEMNMNESRSNSDIASQQGNVVTPKTERVPPASFVATTGLKTDISKKEGENGTPSVEKSVPYADPAVNDEERKQLLNTQRAMEIETRNRENRVPAFLPIQSNDFSSMKSSSNHDNGHLHPGSMNQESPVMGLSKQLSPETRWAAVGVHNEASRGLFSASVSQHELLARKENSASHSQGLGEIANQGHQYVDGNLSNPWKPRQGLNNEKQKIMPTHDSTTMLLRHGSNADANHMIGGNASFSQLDRMYGPGETDKLNGGVPPPKYTTSEKWIMIQQKKRIVNEEKWMQKQQKVNQRISARFNKLKETVNSSEDISAKTRSVIELKKLQLLGLQRRLRSNIVNDFFKPITTEIDRLKAIKKHRIGRRMKHVERYEQRMKEERQKRIRERQKEFFSEVEFHRERLDDVFKFKRERCKGFNRYVKEFHKRKERVHREKIDRIQREKINLLKINDVEGYLRMVQDAKSDRVNKLLKETEKYLQKLSAKLQEAKSISKRFETDTDENQSASLESCDIVIETEDGGDQAKHYKESNEKYYLMAHSIKESIPEQPTGLRGGKLREYQMNGLRWLVSLYNNHLNGILADEMGLGKTVQVISLICYLMETKNDRGPFLVVVPSSVLPGWESELNFWAPDVNKIVYSGPPEERRRLFKERIVHQKFNVLLTTYEYLMNKHDRPKLTKVQWRYIIIDEGHRIKNASCKLNADLKLYQSSHRLLLTGTPLQNNLEELWALLNFLLPNIFNSSEDFSQWFNKPFESNGDNSPDEALLSEEENLLIINRLHQVLRPFVLRRLKHKVENELPEKIERLVRCEASAYQKLLMKRVEDNLGSLGNSKARAVHNSVMELRNICNHPYISQLHSDEVDTLIPKHFLPPIVRLCGKLEMLDRLLPKLKATNHRVLLFSTMTRLLDVMEEYLAWKKYRYLRLDGHTSGLDRGALIDQFNRPDSPYFIFLLSIRAGGVGVNLQAADTVIIFDTDWNPQVDLQAQARAHRIGQKKDVLVLRLETVNTVEEQVRASAEHKLGVANQSITAGFFDNNTSAEDRREYLEALLRESKKEEAAPVLADDALNEILARSELEIDVFESIDQERREEEMATWKALAMEQGTDDSHVIPPLPSRLVTEDDLKSFLEAMTAYEVSELASDGGLKRKAGSSGSFDTQHYGRGKRSREVRSYEEQWTEEEFEKMCQTESADAQKLKDELKDPQLQLEASIVVTKTEVAEPTSQIQQAPLPLPVESSAPINSVATPPVKRGRGRPRRIPLNSTSVHSSAKPIADLPTISNPLPSIVDASHDPAITKDIDSATHQADVGMTPKSAATLSVPPPKSEIQITPPGPSISAQSKVQNLKGQGSGEPVRRRGRKPKALTQPSEQPVKPISVDGASSHTVLPPSSEQSKPKSELPESVTKPSAVSFALPIVSGSKQEVGADSASHCETAETGSQSISHASETQKLQSEGEATAIVEPSPCTSAGPNASGTFHLAVVNEVICSPIISAAPGSSSTPCTSAKLPGKRQRRKSQSGPESSAAGPVASETTANEIHSSTPCGPDIMPGRRQTRRSVSRGKGQSLASTTPAVTSTEQPKINESNTSLPISVPQMVISVPALPGSGNLGVESHVNIPVIPPLAPDSGCVQSSSVSQKSMISSHNLSSAPAIPAAVETAPRRRGRKKGWSTNLVDIGLTTGGQQKDVYEIKKTTGEDSSIIQSAALVAHDTKLEDQPGLSSHVAKPNELSVAASSLDKIDLGAKKIDRGLEVNNASLTKEVGVASCIADATPMSSTAFGETSSVTCQTTRYIVLALKTFARTDNLPSMTPETISRKDEDSKPKVNVDCKIYQPEVNVASKAGSTSHLDEDMNAPPGFDTPHAYSADTTAAGMSLPSEDNRAKEDALAANKGTIQMDSRPTVDFDQNMMDLVQVSEEDSAPPPGFGTDDASALKTRVAGSLNCEHRDSSNASFAQAQDSEPPPVLTEASDEIVKDSRDLAENDSVPPGFCVTQAHLQEAGSEKIVSFEAGVVLSESRAIGGLQQVQITAENPKVQSSNQETTEKLPLLQTETFIGDGCVEKSRNESLGDGAIIVQEVKDHVCQETVVSDLSVHSEKSDPPVDTNNAGTKVSTEEDMGKMDTLQRLDHYCQIQPDTSTNIKIDDDPEQVMCEQESIHRPDMESSSRDEIQTQDSGNVFIHDSKKEGDHLKELHGAPANSEPEVCEQGSDNKENLMACVVESEQTTTDTSANEHNLVLTGNVAFHNGQKDEDDSSCVPDSGSNSIFASKDKEEQHEGQNDSVHPQATYASPDPEAQKNKMDPEMLSDADCGVVDEGQDDGAHPHATCASQDTVAQMNKMDSEMPADANFGVVNDKIDFPQNTAELQEESIGHTIQEIEEQATSPSPVATLKDEADPEVLPDDSASLQATFAISDTEAQKNKMDLEIPSDANCEVVNEGQDDIVPPQDTFSSQDTVAKMNKMDSEMPADADYGVVNDKIDFPRNAELQEESVGHTIQAIEEQATSPSPFATQKDEADPEILPDDSAPLQVTCAISDTEAQKNKMDLEIPSDANCEVVNEGQDDIAPPQDTFASQDTVAKMNKMDSEMPADADYGVVSDKIDFPQNAGLQEESVGHTIQAIEEQATSPSPVATQKDEADPEILPDDSAPLQATCAISDTEAQKYKMDLEVPSDANCEVVNEGQDDSAHPQTTCASSDTEAQKNKMDSEMHSDADCGVVNDNIDFPQSTEVQEESKGHTIQEVEEQDISLSSVAIQKDEADPEILPDADLCGLENRIEAPQNTESQEETKEPTAQEIDQQGIPLNTVSTQLEATSNIADCEIPKEEADPETLPLAEHCSSENKTKILDDTKEQTVLETEQQDVSESPVASQLEAPCTFSGSEVQKDDADDLLSATKEPTVLETEQQDVSESLVASQLEAPCTFSGSEVQKDDAIDLLSAALSDKDPEGEEMSNGKTLLGASMQATGNEMNAFEPCEDLDKLYEQQLDVEAEIKPTDTISEIEGRATLVDEHLQASSEIGAFQECEDQLVKETISQVNEACMNSVTEGKVETNSEIPADAEADTSKDEPALGFQPETAVNTQATDNDMDDFKPCKNPVELHELDVENVNKTTDTNAETQVQEILVDNCIQASSEIGDFQECEDHAGKEIIYQVNEEAGCTNSETEDKIELKSEIPADEDGTLRDEPSFSAQPEAAANTQASDDEMVDFKSCEDPDELHELDVEAEIKPIDTNSEIEYQDMLVDERIQDQFGKERVSHVNMEAGCINSEKTETDSEISADVEASRIKDEHTFDAQQEANSIVVSETGCDKSESIAELSVNTEHLTDVELQKNETHAKMLVDSSAEYSKDGSQNPTECRSESVAELPINSEHLTDVGLQKNETDSEMVVDSSAEYSKDGSQNPTECERSESVAELRINSEHLADVGLQKNETDSENSVDSSTEYSKDGSQNPMECGRSESVAELPINSEHLTDVGLQKNETDSEKLVDSTAEYSKDGSQNPTECGRSESVAELPINSEHLTDVGLQKNETDSEKLVDSTAEYSKDGSQNPTECGRSESVAELPINSEHFTEVGLQKNETDSEMLVDSSAEYSKDGSENPTEAGTSVLETECQKNGCNAVASASEDEHGNCHVSQDKDESRKSLIEPQLEVASTISQTECQKDEINASANVAAGDLEREAGLSPPPEDNVTPSVVTAISETEGKTNENKAEIVAVSDTRDSEIEESPLESPKTES